MNEEFKSPVGPAPSRRKFLLGLGIAAGVALSASVSGTSDLHAQDHSRDSDAEKTGEPGNERTGGDNKGKDDGSAQNRKPANPDSSSSGDQAEPPHDTTARTDENGKSYRVCPVCGSNMYQQGKTWTCENCGYSYAE
jgi:rubredoxin